MTQRSKFDLFTDYDADDVNRDPNLTGQYRCLGDAEGRRLKMWCGLTPQGTVYARGFARPKSITDALRAMSATTDTLVAPEGFDLKIWEVFIIEDHRSDPASPVTYSGYAREPHRYVRLTGQAIGTYIEGTAELHHARVRPNVLTLHRPMPINFPTPDQ